jgi:serine/threonine-protein kinase HipA
MNASDALYVLWDDQPAPVGYLAPGGRGRVKFRYSPEWVEKVNMPISLRLPCSRLEFEPRESTDFFENLLPEGEIYTALCKKHHLRESNTYAFLAEFGFESAGALAIAPSWRRPTGEPGYEDITDRLESLLERRKKGNAGFLLETTKSRLSLAGVQDKIPVHMQNGRYFVPYHMAPGASTSILKAPSYRLPDFHKNEHFCMSLARASGLNVAHTDILHIGKHQILLVERYDRARKDDKILRLHQEDFCQALGYGRSKKYQDDHGPGFADCGHLLLNPIICDSAGALREFVRCAVFNYIIGNCDAHSKNFALLYRQEGATLAPFYDLASTIIYPAVAYHFSMRVGATADFYNIDGDSWRRFCSDMRITTDALVEIMDDMMRLVASNMDDILSSHVLLHGASHDYDLIREAVAKHLKSLESAVDALDAKRHCTRP